MKCQLYSNDRSKPYFVRCAEQATMLWVSPRHELPIPCCAYHAQYCPQGERLFRWHGPGPLAGSPSFAVKRMRDRARHQESSR